MNPTDTGKQRYSNGMYEGEPCTCTELCQDPCTSTKIDGTSCDCDACSAARNDAYDAQFYEAD